MNLAGLLLIATIDIQSGSGFETFILFDHGEKQFEFVSHGFEFGRAHKGSNFLYA